VQYAVAGTTVVVIEANPRASRTVPFVAKATGVPLAKVASRVMLGATLAELRSEGLLCAPSANGHVSIKEAVLPFNRFPEVDPALGPEMRSTGEVMGIDSTFGRAFYKAELAAGTVLPTEGTVFLSLADGDKPAGIVVARKLRELGFSIAATTGTADYLASFGVSVDAVVGKIYNGTVRKIVDFGAFVEILPGTDGLLHISQIGPGRVQRVSDVLKEGDQVKVKVLEVDKQGKIRLSRKEAMAELGEESPSEGE